MAYQTNEKRTNYKAFVTLAFDWNLGRDKIPSREKIEDAIMNVIYEARNISSNTDYILGSALLERLRNSLSPFDWAPFKLLPQVAEYGIPFSTTPNEEELFNGLYFHVADLCDRSSLHVLHSLGYLGYAIYIDVPAYAIPDADAAKAKAKKNAHKTEPFKEVSKREDILQKAIWTVCNDRQDQYGNPEDSSGSIAMLWNAYLFAKGKGVSLDAVDVDLMMALLKIGREAHTHKDDNMVDLAGYAALAAECHTKSEDGRIEELYSEKGAQEGGPTN